MRTPAVVAAAALLVLALSSCSDDDPAGDPAGDAASDPPTSSSAATTETDPAPTQAEPTAEDPFEVPLAEKCEDAIPPKAKARDARLKAGGDLLRGAVFPTPAAEPVTALVLLHQTDGGGLCGWGDFATAAAAAGYPSVAFDLCGYGDSQCSEATEEDPATQVDAAAAFARKRLGVSRVVVLGASMGGSNAAVAAADKADVDAWIDVSGPDEWFIDRPLHDLAPDLRKAAPGMVVCAHSEGSVDFGLARDLASDSGAEFVPADSGHGYELLTADGALTRIGKAVLAFSGPSPVR